MKSIVPNLQCISLRTLPLRINLNSLGKWHRNGVLKQQQFLNSPSRWSTCFIFLSGIVLSSAEGVPSDDLSHFSVSGP
jgi:hypothetical protein